LLFSGGVSRARYAELVAHLGVLEAYKGSQAAAIAIAPPESAPAPAAAPADPEAGWTPNPWQMLGVGFLGGLVVAFLGYWQVRELLRRRQQRALAPKP
jgi:hypothetical protein